jgi:hypothetical protein
MPTCARWKCGETPRALSCSIPFLISISANRGGGGAGLHECIEQGGRQARCLQAVPDLVSRRPERPDALPDDIGTDSLDIDLRGSGDLTQQATAQDHTKCRPPLGSDGMWLGLLCAPPGLDFSAAEGGDPGAPGCRVGSVLYLHGGNTCEPQSRQTSLTSRSS